MDPSEPGSAAALSFVQGCLLVTVPADLYDVQLVGIRERTLDGVHAKAARGVIFDMSAVKVMDTQGFNHLAGTAQMVTALGVRAAFARFQPGAVSALVDMGVDPAPITSFCTCEEALERLTAGGPAEEDRLKDEEADAGCLEHDGPDGEMEQHAPGRR